MKTFSEYPDEGKRTVLINDGGVSAKIDKDKTFQDNYKLLEKKVKSAINRLSKKATDKTAFDDKCKDVHTVLK